MLNHRNNPIGIPINLSWSSLQAFLEPSWIARILKINDLRNQKARGAKALAFRERSLSAAFLERAWSERKPRGQRPRRLQREDIGCGCLCDHGGLGAWAATISARAGMCRQPGTLRR